MIQQALDFLSRPEVMVLGLGVALFLALYWVVRGAPIGQAAADEPSESPSPGRRDRAGALAIFGFLLVLAGAVVAPRYGIPWSLPVFALGFGLILRVQRMSRAYRHVSPSLRRVSEFSGTALSVSLLGGILVVGNVFAFKYGGRPIDFTRDEAFTLSTRSVNLAQSLKAPLKLTLVLGREQRSRRHQDLVGHLASLYAAENPQRIKVERLTPDSPSQAGELDTLLKRVPDLRVALARGGDSLVVEYGEGSDARTAVIELRNLFRDSNGRAGGGSLSTEFSGEDAVTSTLIRFIEGRRVQIGFTAGHGEPSLENFNEGQADGLGAWRTRLGSFGIEAVEVNLLGSDVPEPVEVVVIVAPKRAFERAEIDRLFAAIAKGKPILLAMNGEVPTGLEAVLAKHNLAFERGLISDNQRNGNNNRSLVWTLPIRRGDGAISDSLVDLPFLVPMASPLQVVGARALKPGEPRPEVNPSIVVGPFLRTAQTSRLSGTAPAVETPGPFVVGATASEKGGEPGSRSTPRLVVLGSGAMATNYFLPANADLLMNAVQWLRGRTESVGLSPKVHTTTLFVADPNLRLRLHAIPTIVSFVLILGLGVTTYLARRS